MQGLGDSGHYSASQRNSVQCKRDKIIYNTLLNSRRSTSNFFFLPFVCIAITQKGNNHNIHINCEKYELLPAFAACSKKGE